MGASQGSIAASAVTNVNPSTRTWATRMGSDGSRWPRQVRGRGKSSGVATAWILLDAGPDVGTIIGVAGRGTPVA